MSKEIQIFKNDQLIPLNSDGISITVSGRELHEFLEIKTPYAKWFERMKEYGFDENVDYLVTDIFVPNSNGGKQNQINHEIKLDMAKEIAMIQRNEKGKQTRMYFLQVEKYWNSPEMIMKRALEFANKQVENLQIENEELQQEKKVNAPKVIFADAVATSKTSILVGELAKILKQNGVETGQKRLFVWLRENGYLIKRQGNDYNMPTQKSMELGLFEIKETSITHSDGHVTVTKTPKVTGKGQQYFINKFIGTRID
ncbi:phage antirepressor KilAC domain-containing protein [Clostridium butyricum]